MLDELWQEFQHETQQYKESTEERKLRFEALKKKDEESARTISRQMRKLQKLHVCVCVCVCVCARACMHMPPSQVSISDFVPYRMQDVEATKL